MAKLTKPQAEMVRQLQRTKQSIYLRREGLITPIKSMSKWGQSMRRRGNQPNYNSERKSAPLRKIVEILVVGDNDLFSSGDKVLLECGHTVYTKADSRARCLKCKKIKDEPIQTK